MSRRPQSLRLVGASGARATTADGIVALVRGDYPRAVEILKPIAEHWRSDDSAAQFFIAGLYNSGRGVPVDPLRACALYMRSGSRPADPFGHHASLLFTAAVWARGPEFDAACQRLAVIGFDHGFEPATFDLGPGHSVAWTLGAATVTYDYVSQPEELMFAAPGARFLPVQHTALASGPTRTLVRHFVEMFVWQPSLPAKSWTLQWHVLEIVRDQIVRIHLAEALATADGDTPPSPDGFDVRQYAIVRLDDEGHPEWAVLKGPHPATERIESEAERREVRDATATRNAAMERVDWNERYDVYRHPAMAYADADGCGHVRLFGWTADRAEAFVVQVAAAALNLSMQPATFELSRHPVDISAHAYVYGGPQRQFDFCSDVSTPQPAGSVGPAVWRAISGSVTIELSAPGIRARAPHLRRVTVTLRNLVLENAVGTRITIASPVRLTAIASDQYRAAFRGTRAAFAVGSAL